MVSPIVGDSKSIVDSGLKAPATSIHMCRSDNYFIARTIKKTAQNSEF